MASETVFLSALQPNTSVTTYGLPSDIQLGNGSTVSNEVAKARRVQQQVQMRLAEKSTLPRQNGSVSHYAMSGKHQLVSLLTFKRNYTGFNFCFVTFSRGSALWADLWRSGGIKVKHFKLRHRYRYRYRWHCLTAVLYSTVYSNSWPHNCAVIEGLKLLSNQSSL